MEHTPKINKVEVRTLQMADYRQLSQSFTRVYSDGSDVFWTREQIKKLITIFPEGQVVTVVDDKIVYRRLRLARRMYDYRKELCESLNLKAIMFGGRIPKYHKYADTMRPKEYID